jgi:osmoprotectant transport system ATP-binding protein
MSCSEDTVEAPMMVARGITKRFAGVEALSSVSFSVDRGEVVALVGESGSGKTTLLRCFNRMVVPDEGEAVVQGRDVGSVDPILLRRHVGYVQQEAGLLPHWRVVRNVALVPWLLKLDDAELRGLESLRLVGLDPQEFATRWPHELSGGQRQRVAIARALAARAEVVLLDEPFGALDAITRAELQDVFRRLQNQLETTVLMVTHDLREAQLLADRIAVLYRGRLREVMCASELERTTDPYVRELVARAGLGER